LCMFCSVTSKIRMTIAANTRVLANSAPQNHITRPRATGMSDNLIQNVTKKMEPVTIKFLGYILNHDI